MCSTENVIVSNVYKYYYNVYVFVCVYICNVCVHLVCVTEKRAAICAVNFTSNYFYACKKEKLFTAMNL